MSKLPHYREGLRAVTGSGEYIDDIPTPPGTLYMAIYRSPYAHARILKVDLTGVFEHGGIAYGPNELSKVIPNPFPLAVDAPIKYYPFARDKARFVGEPIAIVLADDPYKAVDLLDYVQVDLEPLKPVLTIDDALKGDVIIHEELKSNIAMHRHMKFGPVDPRLLGITHCDKEGVLLPEAQRNAPGDLRSTCTLR